MNKLTKYLWLPLGNPHDFVNLDLTKDTKLFLNPYLFRKWTDKFSKWAFKLYKSYCKELRDLCMEWDIQWIESLIDWLSESKLLRFGYSKDSRSWVWLWPKKREDLKNEIIHTWIDYISSSKGLDLCDFFWLIDNISCDCLSDAVGNIILPVLIDFTHQSIEDYWISVDMWEVMINVWNSGTKKRETRVVMLPLDDNLDPFVLTPKRFVTTWYQLDPRRIFSRIFLEGKLEDIQDKLYQIGITVDLVSKGKISKWDLEKIILSFWRPIKEMLREYFVISVSWFAKAKWKFIQAVKNQAKNFKLKVEWVEISIRKWGSNFKVNVKNRDPSTKK